MTRISLPFPVPLSACFINEKVRGRIPTKRYLAWQDEALWMIRAQKIRPVKGLVSVYILLVAPDKRHRDAGNCDKAVGDILVKAGIIEDDSNRYVRRLTYEWADEGDPCTVLVQSLTEDMTA